MASRKSYRLIPELVPRDLWGRSAFQMLRGKATWTKKIRPDAITEAGNQCQICSDNAGVLVCHDKWKYNDKARIATLIGFEVHCRSCDAVTHVGRAAQMGDREQVLMEAVITLCTVNECKPPVAVKIIADALDLWMKRSEKRWKIAVAPKLLKTYPDLEGLAHFKPS
jgi:hypothetical protein